MSTEHVKLRYRALAYMRRFGRHRSSRPRASSRHSFADTGGPRPPIRLSTRSGSNEARSPIRAVNKRPIVHVGSRRNFDSTGSNSGVKVVLRRGSTGSGNSGNQPPGTKINTRSRRTSRARKSPRRCDQRRHRFLSVLPRYHGHRFRLCCGCCVEKDVFDPAEASAFHWGVGFEDSYYDSSSYRRLSTGTRFRLELCGFHVDPRDKELPGVSIDVSSVGARATRFDVEFASTPVGPLGRPLTTKLQLRTRGGRDSGSFTPHTGGSAVANSSTGFKRKALHVSTTSYPSYTPTTPPSPFMNDLRPASNFHTTRARSRVSVGCNGWLLSDDDPSIAGWHRRRSSGEIKSQRGATKLSQVSESSQDSEAGSNTSPKRFKTSSRLSLLTSSRPPMAPVIKSSSPANSHGSRASILLLTHDGSVSSTNGVDGWRPPPPNTTSLSRPLSPGTPPTPVSLRNLDTSTSESQVYDSTLPPLHVETRNSYSSSFTAEVYDSAVAWYTDSGKERNGVCGPPSKRRRSTGSSSSNSSGGFGFGTAPQVFSDQSEEPQLARASLSLTARFSLRLTRSHSPKTLKKAISPARRQKNRPTRSQSMLQFGSKDVKPISPRSSAASTPRPSIVFIDCPS